VFPGGRIRSSQQVVGFCISRPPTLSESLAKCAARIDFSKTSLDDLKKEEKTAAAATEEDKDATQFQESLWPWDAVRNKLKDALTEICVLSDVISVAKDKRYLVLDPLLEEADDTKPIVQVYSRKKAISQAAQVLLGGAERLRNAHSEQRSRNVSDFHIELLRLRQNWRLKKVSNAIIGDLSYRTAGSKFGMSGTFEVTKAEEAGDEDTPSSSNNSSSSTSGNNGMQQKASSALRVIVPAELQGVAYIKVITQKDQEDLCTAQVNLMGHGPNITAQVGVWQKTLEYKRINRYNDDSDSDADNEQLLEFEKILNHYDANFDDGNSNAQAQSAAENYQLHFGVEDIRVPEILFQPSMIGCSEAGLAELIAFVLKLFPAGEQQRLVDHVYLTGGCAQFRGLKERLTKELLEMRPFQSTFAIYESDEPTLSAWLGACMLAREPNFGKTLFTRQDHQEHGSEFFREHRASNLFYPTPKD